MNSNPRIHRGADGDCTPLWHALGLCARARALIMGTSMVCAAMRTAKKPRLVLVASDVSENTRKRLNDKCTFYEVTLLVLPLKSDELAHAVGKTSGLATVGLTDENLCRLTKGAWKKCCAPSREERGTSTEN